MSRRFAKHLNAFSFIFFLTVILGTGGLTIFTASAYAAGGTAKGAIKIKDKTVDLKHAYLVKGPDAFDSSKTVSTVIITPNDISKEIAQDVQNVVVSLQFHDITSQKLHGMLLPMDDLRRSLYHLMQETLNLDKGLLRNLPGNERWLSRMRDNQAQDADTRPVKDGARDLPKILRAQDDGHAVELF